MVCLLRIGAAGQLLVTGELAEILPVEDTAAYDAANPIGDDGTVTLDEEKIEARQDAQVRRMLKREVSLVILGGAHDRQHRTSVWWES